MAVVTCTESRGNYFAWNLMIYTHQRHGLTIVCIKTFCKKHLFYEIFNLKKSLQNWFEWKIKAKIFLQNLIPWQNLIPAKMLAFGNLLIFFWQKNVSQLFIFSLGSLPSPFVLIIVWDWEKWDMHWCMLYVSLIIIKGYFPHIGR